MRGNKIKGNTGLPAIILIFGQNFKVSRNAVFFFMSNSEISSFIAD